MIVLPPEVFVDVVPWDDIAVGFAGVVIALLSYLTFKLRRMTDEQRAQISVLHARTSDTAEAAVRAAESAERASYQVTNSHTVNLRDDLDNKFARLFTQMDSIERRVTRTESQTDGLRDDVRALDSRLTRLDEAADREHAELRRMFDE